MKCKSAKEYDIHHSVLYEAWYYTRVSKEDLTRLDVWTTSQLVSVGSHDNILPYL